MLSSVDVVVGGDLMVVVIVFKPFFSLRTNCSMVLHK